MIDELISFFKKTPNEPNRLLFYAHGGLVNETSAKENAILHQYRTFLANGVYPVYFVWESGVLRVFWQHVLERLRGEPGAPLRLFEGRFRDETVVEQFAQEHAWIGDTMKERAEKVRQGRRRAAVLAEADRPVAHAEPPGGTAPRRAQHRRATARSPAHRPPARRP